MSKEPKIVYAETLIDDIDMEYNADLAESETAEFHSTPGGFNAFFMDNQILVDRTAYFENEAAEIRRAALAQIR
jgi:hypothetical protein